MNAEMVQDGFQFVEGPVWVPARQELLFSDIPASKIYRYKAGKVDVFRQPSHQANGNTLDPRGRLVTCEHETRRVTRTELDGTIVPVASHFEGKRLNSPNDVVCKSDGTIYFTDPPYAVKPEDRDLDFQGVYRIAENQIELVARDFSKPNGLCFSPDESILYIADTERGHVRVGDRVFCQVERPDGMRVDAAGNLYIAALKAVEIFSPTGQKIGAITLPERPANLAFGDADRKTLYICARTSLYRVRVPSSM
ncbi:MAG: Gluconolactonase [Verrucomicrobiae bacterium]|nr:Gluconolactonase [Verrucomicrobiae bacterium]